MLWSQSYSHTFIQQWKEQARQVFSKTNIEQRHGILNILTVKLLVWLVKGRKETYLNDAIWLHALGAIIPEDDHTKKINIYTDFPEAFLYDTRGC